MGTWQDEDGQGIVLTIGYNGSTPTAWLDIGPGLSGTLQTSDGGASYSGAMFGGGSVPAYEMSVMRYKYWLEVSFYDTELGDEFYEKFVPAG